MTVCFILFKINQIPYSFNGFQTHSGPPGAGGYGEDHQQRLLPLGAPDHGSGPAHRVSAHHEGIQPLLVDYSTADVCFPRLVQ